MTSFTTPSTWTAGQSVAAATLNQQLRDNMLHVTEIQNWSPTITQTGSVTRTVTYGRYWQTGKRVHATCYLSVTGSGSGTASILLSLPVTSVSMGAFQALGSGWINDASGSVHWDGTVCFNSTTSCGLRTKGDVGFVGATATAFNLASGDIISFTLDYEAA